MAGNASRPQPKMRSDLVVLACIAVLLPAALLVNSLVTGDSDNPALQFLGFALAVVFLMGLGYLWWELPKSLLGPAPSESSKRAARLEYQQALDTSRMTLATSVGTMLIVIGLFSTIRQVQLTSTQLQLQRQSVAGETFARGIDQLNSKDEVTRRTGVATLEQASGDPTYYWFSMQSLADFARDNLPVAERSGACRFAQSREDDSDTALLALLTIARRTPPTQISGADPFRRLDLSCIDLGNADPTLQSFANADFENVLLTGADLGGLFLSGINLRGSNLEGANLKGAGMDGALLRGAQLDGGTCLAGVEKEWKELPSPDFVPTDSQKLCPEPSPTMESPFPGTPTRDNSSS